MRIRLPALLFRVALSPLASCEAHPASPPAVDFIPGSPPDPKESDLVPEARLGVHRLDQVLYEAGWSPPGNLRHSVSWNASLEGSAAAYFQQPEVLVTHTCPNGPAPPPLWLPVGYGISLASLRVGVATALTGLSLSTSLVTQGPADSWPVYAVRIEPAPPGATDGRTHVLRLDLRASRSTAALPLVQAGAGVYYIDAILANPPIELHGQVLEEGTSLTLQLQSGVWFSPGGDVPLNPASATLPRLGGTNGGASGSQP